jgi:initiation factor 1A
MVKNKKGGKKSRRTKHIHDDIAIDYKTDGQEYGQVIKLLGNNRLQVYCFDGTNRMCNIRGKMRKRIFINKDDIVLVSLRDFQDEKGDIIHKYCEEHKRTLIDNNIISDIDFNNIDINSQLSKLNENGENIDKINKTNDNTGYYWSSNGEDNITEDTNVIDLDDI